MKKNEKKLIFVYQVKDEKIHPFKKWKQKKKDKKSF